MPPSAALRKSFVAGKSPAKIVRFKMTTVSFTVGQKDSRAAEAGKPQDVSKMCAARTAVDKHVKVKKTQSIIIN